jgi:hypothetical protein
MREVAVHAGAPRGSLQHCFPGGKEQLVDEAVGWAGRCAGKHVGGFLAAPDAPSPSGLFGGARVRQWTDEYEAVGFAGGRHGGPGGVHRVPSGSRGRRVATWTEPVARALADLGVSE